jgi:hypothetical protein
VIRVARSTIEPQPTETVMGSSTVLPGVPLPAWTLPAEVLPEPATEVASDPAPEPEHAESALEAAVLVASMSSLASSDTDGSLPSSAGVPPAADTSSWVPSSPVSSPFAAPPPIDDAVQIAPPAPRSLPAPEAPAAPTVSVTPDAAPSPSPAPSSEGVVTIGGSASPAASAALLSAPPETASRTADAPSGAPWDAPAPDAPFAPHDTLPQIPAPPPADWEVRSRRRFGLRRTSRGDASASLAPDDVASADDASAPAAGTAVVVAGVAGELPAPTAAPVGLPAPTQAALDLPAPAGQPAPIDLPAPDGVPVAASMATPMTDAVPVPAVTQSAEPADVDAPAVADAEDDRRSHRTLVLLAAVGGAVVVAAVAAFVWPGLLVSHDDAMAPTPASSMPTASAAVAPVTLQTPDKAATYTKIGGAPATALAQAASATTLDGFTAPVTAVYGENGVPKATVIAWAATSPTSPSSITAAFAGFVNASGVAVTSISPVATGTLGGTMRCGVTTVTGKPATACFWADDASFGAVTVLSPATPADGATTATAIRLTIETRG